MSVRHSGNNETNIFSPGFGKTRRSPGASRTLRTGSAAIARERSSTREAHEDRARAKRVSTVANLLRLRGSSGLKCLGQETSANFDSL